MVQIVQCATPTSHSTSTSVWFIDCLH